MDISFLDVLFSVLSLILLIIPGYILTKKRMICEPLNGELTNDKSSTKMAEKVLSVLVLYVGQPMLMINNFQTAYESSIAINMLIVVGLAFLIHVLMIGIVFLTIKGKEAKINCMRFASVFSNCGYMGIPFLQTLFVDNKEIMIYAGLIIAVFNLFNWSIGIYMISGSKKDMNLKNAFLNPTIICIVIGLILFFTVKKPLVDVCEQGSIGDQILEKLMATVKHLANLVTPLAMILIGVKLANMPFKSLFTDKWAYLACVYKLIIMGVLTILIVAWLPIDNLVKACLFFCLAMPSATATATFAVQFGGDSASASVDVLLTTVLSIVTIPLLFLAFKAIVGI